MGFLTAFGGFAGGLSASIEKNRDRKLKQDKINQDKIDAANKLTAKRKEDGFKATENLRKAFDDINAQIEDVKSSDWKGAEDERISRVNELQSQKLGAYKTAAANTSSIGFDLTKDGQFELGANDISQLMKIKSGDKTLIADKGLIQGIKDSNGQYVIDGNEIKSRKLEWSNSQGKMIPVEDKDGNYIYEPTGETLSKYNDVFKTPSETGEGSTTIERQYAIWSRRPENAGKNFEYYKNNVYTQKVAKDKSLDKQWVENRKDELVGQGMNPSKANMQAIEEYKGIGKKGKATSLEQDKQAFADLKAAEKTYQQNPTNDNLRDLEFARDIVTKRTAGVGESGERVEKKDIKSAMAYGKSIANNPSIYNEDEAIEKELNFRYTDVYNKNISLKDDEKDFNKEVISFNRNKGLFDVFDKAVKDGTYKSGIVQGLRNLAVKYTSKEFTNLIELDRKEIKKIIGIEGQVGDGVAIYLKSLSGTAASQAEFARTLNNFVGKDLTQEDIKQEVFSNFIAKKARDLDVSAKRLAKRGLTNVGGSWLARNNKKSVPDSETRIVNGTTYSKQKDGTWKKN